MDVECHVAGGVAENGIGVRGAVVEELGGCNCGGFCSFGLGGG